MTITALGGSCCSSCGSTRSSRDRCTVRAAEELAPAAREVLIPQAVLALMPAVIDRESDVPREWLESRLADPVTGASGANEPWRLPAPPAAAAAGVADRGGVGHRVGGADRAGVGVTDGVGEGHPDGVGQLADHEPVLRADLLAGRPGLVGVPQPHERDRRVAPAEPLPGRRR